MSFIKDYIATETKIMKTLLDDGYITHFIDFLEETRKRKGNIFIIGNGGSASTAIHFAADLNRTHKFQAFSLVENISTVTALINDFDYNDVFKIQLQNLYKKNDSLIVISASGNSQNIINAVEYSNTINKNCFGLIGFDGGILKDKLNDYILIETNKGEYEIVEDLHLIVTHIISKYYKENI